MIGRVAYNGLIDEGVLCVSSAFAGTFFFFLLPFQARQKWYRYKGSVEKMISFAKCLTNCSPAIQPHWVISQWAILLIAAVEIGTWTCFSWDSCTVPSQTSIKLLFFMLSVTKGRTCRPAILLWMLCNLPHFNLRECQNESSIRNVAKD